MTKKIHSLLALGFLGAMLAAMPVAAQAANTSVMDVEEAPEENSNSNSSITITVNTAGTFVYQLLAAVDQWTDVEELTIIGHLNEEDMSYLSRLTKLTKLDLTQTDITMITGCKGLTLLQEALLPSTVTAVGNSAFNKCTNLKELNLPNATTIGNNAFYNCSSLSTVSIPAATSVGGYAFYHCSRLSTLSLPVATAIGNNAFNSCTSLSTLSLPVATSIGNNAFYSCTSLSTVSLPAATSIGERAFDYCSSLSMVSLPAATSIGYEAFSYCTSLSMVSLPAATSIGERAFDYCSRLSTVSLPAATSIDYEAFYYCSSLSTVSLPSCLQYLGSGAFSYCTSLKDVYCPIIVPITTTAFSGVGGEATLHVPAFSVTAYKLSDSWYSFNKIEPLDGVLDQLTINSNFTIVDYTGLADKIDLSLTNNGHLTVSATSPFSLSTFTQEQSTSGDYYYDDWGNRVYYTCSTLIANNEMTADDVTLSLKVQTNRWNFISLPFDVNVADIEYPEGTLWVIRKYSGADRAALTGNTWQNMTNGMVLQAGEGYILHCANQSTSNVEFVFHAVDNEQKNNIFAHQDVVKPLTTYASEHAHNRSWNLVGNPYPAYFDTQSIEHNGVITTYTASSYGGGSYTAYSLLDDNYVLRPNEAFFVQCPADANSMTFKAEGRMHDSSKNSSNARSQKKEAKGNRLVYNFTLGNTDFTDRARLVINPEAKMDYEISCDASKFMSDNQAVPQLYVLDRGIRYAIDERPLGDGIVALGTRFGHTGEYTLALTRNPAEDMPITLIDNETGRQVNIAEESYSFTAQAGTCEGRFTLQIGNGTTGISEELRVKSEEGLARRPEGESHFTTASVYDMSGRRVSNKAKGVYIIKQNGKNRKMVK